MAARAQRGATTAGRGAEVHRSLAVVERFAPEAERLRAVFDARFADPRAARADRFVWDFWHVPGQYTLLRTPAWEYFPRRLYRALHARLVRFGRERLGCHDISPPWLSCYVEGCRQELHGDLPHGPWAFVLSLTRPHPRRRGGETLLVRDEVLDFWEGFESERSVEEEELLLALEPRFNRLLVFDPRIPHGVRRVEGTLDPREGRLVIHGWFVQPRPFVSGGLDETAFQRGIDALSEQIAPLLAEGLPGAGLLALGFRVEPSGRVRAVEVLSDTTRVPAASERARREVIGAILEAVGALRFPRRARGSRVALPLMFAG